MRARSCLILVLFVPFLGLSPSLSQGPSGKNQSKEPKPKQLKPLDEDKRILDGIKEVFKAQETERDKLLKEVRKLPQPAYAAAGDEFSLWFEMLSGGRGSWIAAEKPKPLRELSERIAGRLGIPSGPITREQFLRYARQYLTEGSSSLWRSPSESAGHLTEMNKAFNRLDRNGDGVLGADELPDSLSAERQSWDANRDGFIDLQEYGTYFEARMRQMWSEGGITPPTSPKGPNLPTPSRPAGEEGRSVVYHHGRLPSELPAWFIQYDTDRDAQVCLYEWRYSGRSPGEFTRMDGNNDGFLTPEELLRHLRAGGNPGDSKMGKSSSKGSTSKGSSSKGSSKKGS